MDTFELVETTGDRALAIWEELKGSGRGSPVVLGVLGEGDFVSIETKSVSPWISNRRTVAEILSAANGMLHPRDLVSHREREFARVRKDLNQLLERAPNAAAPRIPTTDAEGNGHELARERALAEIQEELKSLPIEEWSKDPLGGLSVALDIRTKKPLAKVYVALIPSDDWTTIPAHLHWGGWNDCPPAEYHVAALRSWRERYGAELVGLSFDTMNVKVKCRPQTPEEALELADEQWTYCSDIVAQGPGFYGLAAQLMADPWWYFWWD
jgi:uncharacterized protein DUF4253